MPEANLFLMFTQRLNTLGVAYMVSGSVAVIYGEPRLTHHVEQGLMPVRKSNFTVKPKKDDSSA